MKKGVMLLGICIILSILIINAEEINSTFNETIVGNYTLSGNLTLNKTIENITLIENLTLNNTFQNITIIKNLTENITISIPENSTNFTAVLFNLTIINNTLTNLLENLTNNSSNNLLNYTNGSYCYLTEDSIDYNKTINGTLMPMTLNLSVTICYNETAVYCYSQPHIIPTLFKIDVENYTCRNGYCEGAEVISNPYDISSQTFNEATSFICFGKIQQDGYSLWLWRAVNLYDDGNIFYFDFSNSSFNMFNFNVTNTTIFNITNNITNDIVNNITNNFTYLYDLTNNVTADLSGLEERISILEAWRVGVDETINYLLSIIEKISKFFEKNIYFLDFSNSHFTENKYNVTNEVINNITNNITNEILNNETNNFNYVYNITNNITAENLTQLEARVSVLETWKEQAMKTLDYLVQKFNEILAKIEDLF